MRIGDELKFRNRQAQFGLAAFSCVIILIGLSGLVADNSSRVTGAVFTAWGIASLARALNSSDVVLDAASVRTRSIVRTRRFPFADLARVEVRVGRTGINGFGREYLVLHLKAGGEFGFRELNSKPSDRPNAASVQRAAAAISAKLERAA